MLDLQSDDGAAWAPGASPGPGRENHLPRLPVTRDFGDVVERRLAECRRSRATLAIVCIGVDDLDLWRQSHGAEVVYSLLRDLSRRLRHGLREHDEVWRLGDDRFGVVLCGSGAAEACVVQARLSLVLAAPYRLGPLLLGPRVYLGAAAMPAGIARGAALVQAAWEAAVLPPGGG